MAQLVRDNMKEQLEQRLSALRQQRDQLHGQLAQLNNQRESVTAQLNGTIGAIAEVEYLLAQTTREPVVDRPAREEAE